MNGEQKMNYYIDSLPFSKAKGHPFKYNGVILTKIPYTQDYNRAKELFKNTGIVIADSEHGAIIIGIWKPRKDRWDNGKINV